MVAARHLAPAPAPRPLNKLPMKVLFDSTRLIVSKEAPVPPPPPPGLSPAELPIKLLPATITVVSTIQLSPPPLPADAIEFPTKALPVITTLFPLVIDAPGARFVITVQP